jgi:hypothetical protein
MVIVTGLTLMLRAYAEPPTAASHRRRSQGGGASGAT